MIMVLISWSRVMHGDLFLSKTAAAIHTLGFQKGSSSARLLFLKLAVHRTALKRGALFCSSPSTLLNENFFTSCALVERRQLGSLEEHILEHSLSTSFRKCCCRCFRSMGFFHAAVAIWPYVPRHNIFPKLSNPSGSVFTFTLLGQWTYTCTTVLLSSWPCSCMIAGLTEETLGITSNVGLMFFTGVEKWI